MLRNRKWVQNKAPQHVLSLHRKAVYPDSVSPDSGLKFSEDWSLALSSSLCAALNKLLYLCMLTRDPREIRLMGPPWSNQKNTFHQV